MVLDAEGVDDGVVAVDGSAEEFVEAVLVNAFSGGGAVEAAEAASLERELFYVD